MSAPARERRRGRGLDRLHLPSVHVRDRSGSGFDYEEDLFISGRGRRRRVERRIRLVAIERGQPALVRETRDVLCAEEIEALEEVLPVLMDEGNPAAQPIMEECGRKEFARQLRIAAGEETACAGCGCSETRACSGGCCWATATLCSRCV